MKYTCQVCKAELDASDTYEHRGAHSCAEHFDEVCESREFERYELMVEERHKTDCFGGLDLSPDTKIGRANREILAGRLEVASKEPYRLKKYEGRE